MKIEATMSLALCDVSSQIPLRAERLRQIPRSMSGVRERIGRIVGSLRACLSCRDVGKDRAICVPMSMASGTAGGLFSIVGFVFENVCQRTWILCLGYEVWLKTLRMCVRGTTRCNAM